MGWTTGESGFDLRWQFFFFPTSCPNRLRFPPSWGGGCCALELKQAGCDAGHLDCVWNMMAHAQKPDFVFRRNGRVHLNWRGRQFSRLLAAEVCTSAVVMVVMLDTPCFEVGWRVLATHSIRQFSLYFPSRASPCAITFQLDSTWVVFVCFRCCRCYSSASATAVYSLPVVFLTLGAEAWTPEFRRPRDARELHLRSALFWDFTEQRKVVGHYRHFGTICFSHLQGSYRPHIEGSCLTPDMGWTVWYETSVRNYILRWVKSQNSSRLLHTAAEAWNHHPHWSVFGP